MRPLPEFSSGRCVKNRNASTVNKAIHARYARVIGMGTMTLYEVRGFSILRKRNAAVYLAAVILFIFIASTIGKGAELKQEIIDAFDRHVAAAEARLNPRFQGQHFLWSDDSAQRHRQVAQGTVVVQPAGEKGSTSVKGGLIHDYTGAAFIPGVTLAETLKVVQDYGRHKSIYPEVADAKVLSHQGNDFKVYMRIVGRSFSFPMC